MRRLLVFLIALCIFTGCTQSNVPYRKAVGIAGEWFLTHSSTPTFIHYEYLPEEMQYSTKLNNLRKMGALWSITQLQRFTGDERYGELIQRGLKYFELFVVQDPEGFAYVDMNDKRKLGFSAFMILSLVGTDAYPGRGELMRELAEGILHQQHLDGSYKTYFHSDRNTGTDYYPGEANLALMALFEETGEERYKKAVERSFSFYREYWRSNRTLAFIPWHTQALWKLYQADPQDEYRDFIFEMTDWMLMFQQTPTRHMQQEYIGGFTQSPGNSTASYLEGTNDAYLLAKEVGDAERTERYGNAVQWASAFILKCIVLESTDPKALGGVSQSLRNPTQRVDYNQHAIAAFIKGIENGLLQ